MTAHQRSHQPPHQLQHHPSVSSLLSTEIRTALKNRQNVELRGRSAAIRALLDSLIRFERGTNIVAPTHAEDHTLHILPNITFPVSDKMTPENVMRQVLQEFGWPTTPNLSHVQFYFGKLLKELHHDRIVPVLLFEHTEILRRKAFKILSILSEHTVDRRPLGVPSILCITERGTPVSSLQTTSIVIEVTSPLTRDDIERIIESAAAGSYGIFDPPVIHALEQLPSSAQIVTTVKELHRFGRRLGLERITSEVYDQWKQERTVSHRKRYATTND
ncbi:MAG: hypothetical protein JSS75_13365 [Bacteroidetes bacterium]|nr:hypothetical protein [Bacteroidota bacterium]